VRAGDEMAREVGAGMGEASRIVGGDGRVGKREG
jgi:hypothetical protein